MSRDLLSVRSFSVARVLMALCVFLCHVFEQLNYYGFLFVGVFFFMSGYGMELKQKRLLSLVRLPKYLCYYLWFSLLYFMFFMSFPYPSSWFLVVYFAVMLLYRFFSDWLVLFVSFLIMSFFFMYCGMYGWGTSFGAFLFGMIFTRMRFDFKHVLIFLPLSLFLFLHYEFGAWGFIPLFAWIVLSLSSLSFLSFLVSLAPYTFFFYCSHCFCLGLFGATWTLGGSPAFVPVFSAFVLSCVFSVFFKDCLFSYPRKCQ